MSAIRSTHTKLEDMVTKELWRRGFRFIKYNNRLRGKPDISIKKYKIAIFIDSCFWHLCELHGHVPKSNIDYWSKKLQRNKERDQEITSYYQQIGWHILRIWEHEINEDFESSIDKIATFISKAKNIQK